MQADELNMRRCSARCGCTDHGPGEACGPGQRLFSELCRAYAGAVGALPSDEVAWSPYELLRLAYYQHLGERPLPHTPAGVAALLAALALELYTTELTTIDACQVVADGLLQSLRPDLFPPDW